VEGGEVELPGPDGEPLSVRLEEGAQSGSVVALEGRGLPVLGRPGLRGNRYLQVWVATPQDLDRSQREALRRILSGQPVCEGGTPHRGWKEWLHALFGG